MRREGLVFGIAGTFFGVLIGWIIGSQYAGAGGPAAGNLAPVQQTSASREAPPLDTKHAADLERQANSDPENVEVRINLGDLYMDAKRHDLAIPWYQAALKLDPKNVNVSTDLGACYYSTNDVDRALAQLANSLAIDPRHSKTLLNLGIVRAFGKGDLKGAGEAWAKVIDVAPGSDDAKRARMGLESLASGQHEGQPPAGRSGRGGPGEF